MYIVIPILVSFLKCLCLCACARVFYIKKTGKKYTKMGIYISKIISDPIFLT